MTKSNKFNFFVPINIEKASGDNPEMKISGVCSSVAEDSDGEVLEPTGFDFKPLLKNGFFNWNHQANSNPAAIVGKPTSAKVINGGKDFYVEGVLYKGSKEAEAIYNLAQTLATNDPDRQLGFSIEGQAIERDKVNPKRIRKARITGIAITHCPKNPNTLLNIIKGEYEEPITKGEEISLSEAFKPYKEIIEKALKNKKKPIREEFESEEEFEKACHEFEKAMSVNLDLNPPSIDGVKPKDSFIDSSKPALTKSETYNQIFQYLEEQEDIINKSKQIFELTTKISDMSKTPITQDTLDKAFAILDLAKGESTTGPIPPIDPEKKKDKPEDGGDDDEDDKDKGAPNDEGDDVEKAELADKITYLAKSYISKSKLTPIEAIDKLTRAGYPGDIVKSCVKDITDNLEKGDFNQPLTATLESTPDNQEITEKIEMLIKSNQDLQKSLIDNQNEKFSAIGEILKSQTNAAGELKRQFSDITDRLEKVENSPLPAKSATRISYQERFEKSDAGDSNTVTLSISNPEHRKSMSDMLMNKLIDYKGKNLPTNSIEKSINGIEMLKTLDPEGQMFFKSLGYSVIN